MKIKKRPIISWLLDENNTEDKERIGFPMLDNKMHSRYLLNGLKHLEDARENGPYWGLPELIMPSFEEVMKKSAKSFYGIDHELFQEFYNDNVCGILISKDLGTIVYGFGENTLYVWVFREIESFSLLYLYFYIESTEDNKRAIYAWPTLTDDEQILSGDKEEKKKIYEVLANRIITYLAVKKYVKVETVKVPMGKTIRLNEAICDYKGKDKIRNESGQEVIVLDSRWFRKIVNDNNIFVRGFFRLQNKKNEKGELYKELFFVDSYIRHGYHRDAKIEDNED